MLDVCVEKYRIISYVYKLNSFNNKYIIRRLKILLKILIFFVLIFTLYGFIGKPEWGFFAHKRINRLAVFTLPPEMMYFFKSNIEYITEHSTTPDKLKFVNPHEGIRHYIDIDIWGEYPFDNLARTWSGVMEKYAVIYLTDRDTSIMLFGPEINTMVNDSLFGNGYRCSVRKYRDFIRQKIAGRILYEAIEFDTDSLALWLQIDLAGEENSKIQVSENFSQFGILPYYIYDHYYKLVRAFREMDAKRILQLATHLGHYLGDAHVPLHTTKNYNGQLTNQIGIHAFWESKVPEMLSDDEYDFFVGKAEYIDDIRGFIWKAVLESHSHKDEVLRSDSLLRLTIPDMNKFVFRERNGIVVKTESEQYVRAFNDIMNDMVEKQMRASVKALGDMWFTAWIDAGQPDLTSISDIRWNEAELKEQEKILSNPGTGVMHGCGQEH